MSDHERLGWLISVKGWERMATRPKPYYAHTEDEKDWYLRNSGDPDRYNVERVPDPYSPEERAVHEYFVAHGKYPPEPSGV